MKKWLVLGMILCLALAIGGCAKEPEPQKEAAVEEEAAALTEAPSEGPRAGGVLVYGRGGDSVGLDPAYETDGNSFMVCDNVFEQLVSYKDETTDIQPGLAKSWEVSPDGLTYTFHLREGVMFHDGTTLNLSLIHISEPTRPY